MRPSHSFRILAAALLGAALPAVAPLGAQVAGSGAGTGARKPITQDTYDIWRTIQGATLSRDGQWAVYTQSPVVGDGELVARATRGATEYRVARGYTGRPTNSVAANAAFTAPPAQITADSRWAVALAYAPQAEFEQARRAKKKPAQMPRASLALVSLADGQVTRVPRVKSFQLARESGRFMAYLLEPADSAARADSTPGAAAPVAAAAAPGGTPRPVADTVTQAKKKDVGSTLVIRELATGRETRVEDVLEYAVDERAQWVAYAVSSRSGARDGAYVRALESGRETALLTGPGKYGQLAFDERGAQIAFVSDRAEAAREKPRFALYHATLPAGRAVAVVQPAALGADVVAEKGAVRFTKSGTAVLFGLAPAPLDSIPADSLADKAVFDLWHWKDPRLQPQQIVEAGRDRSRAYTAIYQVGRERMVRLANDSMPEVTVSDDGRTALAVTDAPYAVERMWGDGGNDVHVIDAMTGRRTTVARRVPYGATLSPGGRYVLWFADGRWHSWDVAASRAADVTGALAGVRFDQETWDTPSTPAPWGVAGWTTGDRSVLLYDRYDVWEADPAGARAPRMVTDSVGRRRQLVFRLVDLDREARAIDAREPLLFRVLDDETKASGFWRDRLGAAQQPESLVMADRAFGTPQRARDAEVYLLTQSTLREFPDLWVGPSLTSLARVSDANPQQQEYRWADVELVRWRSDEGVPLKGLLFKPDDFDPSKKYPMVVYFYEQLSDGLHNYAAPTGRNVINPVVYASKGYLVFFPDIAYRDGYPGQSALHSIVPGVLSLVARGFVDANAIGSAGQSWGGYQTAYMITQTPIFKAAMAGAPVANMTSAYGGIRWDSGLARAFQYEKTQSRIGGSIWEYPMRFIENSPLFYADRVRTPLLMMHNDGDGAVPWYQGIELFVALRRLGQEVYLVNYNGDGHNPRKRANQKDVDLRMQQFFDHHLRGAPAPAWMTEGIPFLRKGRDQLVPPVTAAGEPGGEPGGEPAPGTPAAGATGAPVPVGAP
ncbi:MAG TPA: prolyl oligopeptidase family serine peptidase [Gemmatimonadaceae bacterium]|nr:prolyl oligopeptidase family serine peptidase [Gemmatimonadaceae bacterium]